MGDMRSTIVPRPSALPAAIHENAATAFTPPQVLDDLRTASLDEIDRAQLHDRVETKVVMHAAMIPAALSRLSDDYLVMEHEGSRTQRYSNTYFDTSDLRNYLEHHNQKRQRSKIRYRTYANSGITFFEIKRNVDGRTVKERKLSAPTDGSIRAADVPFLRERLTTEPQDLEVSVVVDYDRILLVRDDFQERVTIDTNLRFTTSTTEATLPGLAVVEFKQPRLDRTSPAVRAIPRPTQMFSKYCMGLASCDSRLKRNRFKKVFLGLHRLEVTPQVVGRTA